jgi:hypothetical protein
MVDQPDPVLLELQKVMDEQGLNRSQLAEKLGVSRSAMTSWMLELQATQHGHRAGSAARRFRFVKQGPEVQGRIAQLLAVPVGELTAMSRTGQDGADHPIDPAAWSGTRNIIEALAARSLARSLQIIPRELERGPAHDIAEVAQSVPGVGATMVVEDIRGLRHPTPWQHQVVIFSDSDEPRESLRSEVEQALAHAALPATWEHGSLEPGASVTNRNRRLGKVGSLISRRLEGSRGPQAGRLLPSGRLATPTQATDTTLAVFIGSASSTYQITPGLLADSAGVGFLRGGDLVRRMAEVRHQQLGLASSARLGIVDEQDAAEAGFVLRNTVDLLGSSTVAGAWTMSIDMRTGAAYDPLLKALGESDAVVLTCRLGPQWRRFAAWRMATIERNTLHQSVIDPVDPTQPAEIDPETFHAHHDSAERWLTRFEEWEAKLDDLEAHRCAAGLAPTIRIPLDELPSDYHWLHPDGSVGGGSPPPTPLVFTDDIDPLVDARIEASAAGIAALATVLGRQTREQRAELVERLAPTAVTRILRNLDGPAWRHAEAHIVGPAR